MDNPIQLDKRAQRGFFGMRGKKIPRWELRGKFVGVRGKKWASANAGNMMHNGFDNLERIGLKSSSTTQFGEPINICTFTLISLLFFHQLIINGRKIL